MKNLFHITILQFFLLKYGIKWRHPVSSRHLLSIRIVNLHVFLYAVSDATFCINFKATKIGGKFVNAGSVSPVTIW